MGYTGLNIGSGIRNDLEESYLGLFSAFPRMGDESS